MPVRVIKTGDGKGYYTTLMFDDVGGRRNTDGDTIEKTSRQKSKKSLES